MEILLVEDDHLQADALRVSLARAFPGSLIRRIATESDFRSWLDRRKLVLPDVIVIDMMLRWADPGPEIPEAPVEVKANGRYRAGERCRALLRSRPETERIPVILHTVLERSDVTDLPEDVVLVTKESDPSQLIDQIHHLIS